MSHPLLEQMCESDTNVLCVVTSVVETAATVLLSSQDSVDGKVNTKVCPMSHHTDFTTIFLAHELGPNVFEKLNLVYLAA